MFANAKALVGMIHVGALPGTPRAGANLADVIRTAVEEARIYRDAGFDGLMIENMHDTPYVYGDQGPEITAAMTAVGVAVKAACDLPLGVQILACGNREALAVALACDAEFVRVENFAYAHVADEGLMERAEAGPLLRRRKHIGAEHVKIAADVKKKHASHAITADVSIADATETADFFGADALVVTGTATGKPTSVDDVVAVRQATRKPVWIGSGVTPENAAGLWPYADALIVGSYVKRDGLWSNPVDPQRVRAMRAAVQ